MTEDKINMQIAASPDVFHAQFIEMILQILAYSFKIYTEIGHTMHSMYSAYWISIKYNTSSNVLLWKTQKALY